MNILLTNDDGIDFIGIKALEKALASIATIYVAAPRSERSGSSQAITLWQSIKVEKKDEHHLIVDAYPTDCVNIALLTDFFPKIDLVISGINKGVNLGDDIYYSGTVAAVRHAAICKVPGIAISHDCKGDEGKFTEIAEFIKELVESDFLKFEGSVFYNINYPSPRNCPPLNLKMVSSGRRIYLDKYNVTKVDENNYSLDMKGSGMDWDKTTKDCDLEAIEDAYITITPLHLDSVNYTMLDKLKALQKENKDKQNIN